MAGEHKKKGRTADSTQSNRPLRRINMVIELLANLTAKRKDIREEENRQALLPCAVLLEGAVRPANRRNGWHPESK